MPLTDVTPTLFVVTVEGIAERGRNKLDTLQVYFLQMMGRRARQLGEQFWPRVTPREMEYLTQTLLAGFQGGVFGGDHVIAHALGVGVKHRPRRRIPAADTVEILTQGLRRTLTPGIAMRRPVPASGAARGAAVGEDPDRLSDTPFDMAVREFREYQLALLERNTFAAQKSWRRFERAIDKLNPRVIAYIKVNGVNQALAALKEVLPDVDTLLHAPDKNDADRLRAFISHAKGLSRMLQYQAKTVDDSLNVLPDPDVLLKRRA